ncbi:hypothetical protein RYH80_09740 [Halobaculum sp. MBLA0147]
MSDSGESSSDDEPTEEDDQTVSSDDVPSFESQLITNDTEAEAKSDPDDD